MTSNHRREPVLPSGPRASASRLPVLSLCPSQPHGPTAERSHGPAPPDPFRGRPRAPCHPLTAFAGREPAAFVPPDKHVPAAAIRLTHTVSWLRGCLPRPGPPVGAAVGLRPPVGRQVHQVRTRSLHMTCSGPVPGYMTRSYTMTIQSGQDPFLAYDLFRTWSRLYDPFIYNYS